MKSASWAVKPEFYIHLHFQNFQAWKLEKRARVIVHPKAKVVELTFGQQLSHYPFNSSPLSDQSRRTSKRHPKPPSFRAKHR
jgi:hypothetical protein